MKDRRKNYFQIVEVTLVAALRSAATKVTATMTMGGSYLSTQRLLYAVCFGAPHAISPWTTVQCT